MNGSRGPTGNNTSRMNGQAQMQVNSNRIDKTSVEIVKVCEVIDKIYAGMSGIGVKIGRLCVKTAKVGSRIGGTSGLTARISEAIVHSGWAAIVRAHSD